MYKYLIKLLFVCLCALVLQPVDRLRAQGVAVARPPLGDDPYISLMTSIADLIEKKCIPQSPRTLRMVVLGVLPQDTSFSPDQKDYLYQQFRSAASHVYRSRTGVKQQISISDVGEALTILRAGESRATVQEFIDKSNAYDIGIQVKGARYGGQTKILLIAIGKDKLDCHEQTQALTLPPNAFPEQVFRIDELLSRAAEHVLERSLDRQTVQLRSLMSDGTQAPEIWRESLARSFNRGVPLARGRLPSKTLEGRDVVADPSLNYVNPDRWRTDVTMSHGTRSIVRLEVDVRPPEKATQEGTAFDGLIDADSLPALPLPVPSQQASRPTASRDKATARPSAAPAGNPELPLSVERSRRVLVALNGLNERRELVFTLIRNTVVEIDIVDVQGEIAPLATVLNQNSKVLPPDFKGQARPNLTRWRLGPGNYTLMLQAKTTAKVEFVVRTRAAFDSLEPEPGGEIKGMAGDWIYGSLNRPGKSKLCYALTPAVKTEPSDWRLLLPQLIFQVYEDIPDPDQSFDETREWRDAAQVVAEVQRRGTWQPIKLGEEQGRLKSLMPCVKNAGEKCLRSDTLRELTSGTMLNVFGPKKDGQRGSILYSLQGYQSAMFSAASLCGRKELARSLIVRP